MQENIWKKTIRGEFVNQSNFPNMSLIPQSKKLIEEKIIKKIKAKNLVYYEE